MNPQIEEIIKEYKKHFPNSIWDHYVEIELRDALRELSDSKDREWESDNLNIYLDGNMWCATRKDFTNLQESLAGFGETKIKAVEDLYAQEWQEKVDEARREQIEKDIKICEDGIGKTCWNCRKSFCEVCLGDSGISGNIKRQPYQEIPQFKGTLDQLNNLTITPNDQKQET